MRGRWLLFRYIDPNLPLSRPERKRVHRRSHALLSRGPVGVGSAAFAVLLILLPVATLLGMISLLNRLQVAEHYVLIVGSTVAAAIFIAYLGVAVVARRIAAPAVHQALREAGHDVCLRCGYCRTGVPVEHACPECGEGDR